MAALQRAAGPLTQDQLRLLMGYNFVEETGDGKIAFAFETGVGPAVSTHGGMAVMGDDLTQLPFVMKLSHRTRRLISTNIAFALAVKATIFALAALGLATLWMAVVADVGASAVVILNGMRLRTAR